MFEISYMAAETVPARGGGRFMAQIPVFVLNGPNLNLLGVREPEIYGAATLDEIEASAKDYGRELGLGIDFRQSNNEGTLIDWVQEAGKTARGLIINPGGYTHTSVALHDALRAAAIPKIELHLSNIHGREDFRRKSLTAPAVNGVIMGFGPSGYRFALEALKSLLENQKGR